MNRREAIRAALGSLAGVVAAPFLRKTTAPPVEMILIRSGRRHYSWWTKAAWDRVAPRGYLIGGTCMTMNELRAAEARNGHT